MTTASSYTWVLWMVLAAAWAGCNTTKYLQNDQILLASNEIKLTSDKKIPNKRNLAYELTTLYKQVPNTNTTIPPFVPREWWWFYVKNKPDGRDSSKINRFILREWAEPPVIYDEELAEATARSMQFYLQNKGYFDAVVVPDDNIRKNNKKIDVTYLVHPNQLYTIDTTIFTSSDTVIQRILNSIHEESLLKKGEAVSAELYNLEANRITTYLRNNGYAFFYPNFIAPLQGDSLNKEVRLELEVLPPGGNTQHQIYTIGDIFVFPDYDPLQQDTVFMDTIINGVHFYSPDKEMRIRPQVLLDAIQLESGELYRQENFDLTNQRLNALGVFRFVSVRQEIDSLRPDVLNYRILLTRTPRMEFGTDVEVNYADRNLGRNYRVNLIGLALNLSLSNRNLFGGAESLTSNVQTGVEINPAGLGNNTFWNTVDIRLQAQLNIPKFVDYLGLWKGLYNIGHKKGQEPSGFYKLLDQQAITRLTGSYNYVSLLNFYDYYLLNAAYGYDVQQSNTHRILINHIGIDYLSPDTKPQFDTILMQNPFLGRSFGQQLFTGFLLRDASFIFNSRPNRFGESWYFGINGEVSGAEVELFNGIYNAFSLEADTFRLGDTDFSRYVRLELDGRYSRNLTPKQSVAFRLNFGIASPFGLTADVPYVKQFYVGGPNSIRAFNAREVGPGSYQDPLTADPENRLLFYQTGDLKLEFNAEYRLDYFKFYGTTVEGAFFLDAGNVWTLQEDATRPASQFLFKPRRNENGDIVNDMFLKQAAIGTGTGLRFDFSFFVFRFDLGYPLRIPAQEDGVWVKDFRWRNANFNLALGYPF